MMPKGFKHSDKTKLKMSISHKGKRPNQATEFKKGMIPWNKGLECFEETKRKISIANKGKIGWWEGKKHSKETKDKISLYLIHNKIGFQKGYIPWNKDLKGYKIEPHSEEQKRKISVSKKGSIPWNKLSEKERKIHLKVNSQKRRKRMKNAGELTVETVQLVYEDNIKQFGTLTCIYCLIPLKFGKDHLEHKIPISRGGTNKYNNLAIACINCNSRKGNKTVEEYKKYLKED